MKNWLRIGSLLMFMAFTPAFAGNCDCKDDPLAKGGCGLKPEAMEDSNPFSEAACTAGESAFSSFEDAVTALFKSGAEDLDSTLVPKHKGELLDYLSCYRESDQQFCHFRKSLAPYVAYACKVTGFPLSIESCLLMKESSFDGSAKSDVGALGYSQLMSKTLKDLDKCFQYTQTGWTGEIDRVNREIADIKSGKAKLAKKDISPTLKMKETTLLIYRARRKV
ncbi:MAG: hypothetical protein EBX52_08895, partial [Proteobacteria bacterium]|nr:hypothetical protein [Pseudomonadota bacterium]